MPDDRYDATAGVDLKRLRSSLAVSTNDADARHTASRTRRAQEFHQSPAYFLQQNSWTVWGTVFRCVLLCCLLLWYQSALKTENDAQKRALSYIEKNAGSEFDHVGHGEAMRDAREINGRDPFAGALSRMIFENRLMHRLSQYENHFFQSVTGAMQQDTVIVVFGAIGIAAVVYLLVTTVRTLFDRRMWAGAPIIREE